jgi:hypothetical protein
MEARRCNPFLGLAIAVSISFAAQAQYFPPGQVVLPQQMVIVPQGMPSAMPMMAGARNGMPAMEPGVMGGPMMASAPMMRGPDSSAPQPNQQRGQAVAETENFIVFASDTAWAEEVAKTAEQQRRELAEHWLGKALPPWSGRCPIHVQDAPELGAGGETQFVVERGVARKWMMSVQGTRERILDSVLPHEISHTIFATHFGRFDKYVPRWADEGAATTVEHEAEKSKHRFYLRKFLQTGRGLAFNKMFQLKEYPKDILPLYAQGHSAVQFLIDQSNPRRFIQFLELGMQTENWPAALAKFYDYESIGDFQARWNKWLFDGSPEDLVAYAPVLRRQQRSQVALASTTKEAAQPINGASDRLPSDPKSLDLLPSHPQAAAQSGDLAAEVESNTEAVALAASQQGSLLSLEDAIVLAARQQTAIPLEDQPTADLSGESWYKRKLRQTSGQSATPIPQHNNFPGEGSAAGSGVAQTTEGSFASRPMTGLRPAPSASSSAMNNLQLGGTSTALPQQAQGVGVQVLEWGQGSRFSGLRGDNATYR